MHSEILFYKLISMPMYKKRYSQFAQCGYFLLVKCLHSHNSIQTETTVQDTNKLFVCFFC